MQRLDICISFSPPPPFCQPAGRLVGAESAIFKSLLLFRFQLARYIHFLASLIFTLIWIPGSLAKTDELGRVRVLFLGAIPLTRIMSADPSLQAYPVPAYLYGMGDEDVRRSLRTYMPRTYEKLVASYDVIHICDSGASSYTPTWLRWMADAVIADGLGFVMSGGAESFGGHLTQPPWGDTSVGEVLAVDCRITPLLGRFFKMIVTKPDDPLMASLPFETAPAFHTMNTEASPKEGALTLAVADIPSRDPVAAVIQVGQGRSLSFTPYIASTRASTVPFAGWEFHIDFVCNLHIYPAQIPLPADYLRTHILRNKLAQYSQLRKTVIDILAFADMFGANTAQADDRTTSADQKMAEARALYITKELDESENLIDQAFAGLEQAQILAMKAKDRALIWIYSIEWLAVTGTAMACGFVLWSLMVRRRIYKEVGATRLTTQTTET